MLTNQLKVVRNKKKVGTLISVLLNLWVKFVDIVYLCHTSTFTAMEPQSILKAFNHRRSGIDFGHKKVVDFLHLLDNFVCV